MQPKRFLGALSITCAAGMLLRALAVALVPTVPVSDFWTYFDNATQLLAGEPYPGTDYPPGYPVFLDLCFLLAPEGSRLLAAKLGNVCLGAVTILLSGQLARALWGERAGLAAAALTALCPMLVLLPCLIASENLFIPALLALVLVVRRGWREERAWKLAAAAGAVAAVAALTRSLGYLVGGFWLLGLLVPEKRRWVTLAEVALLLLVQHLVMLPWGLHNLRHHGRFTFRSSNGGLSLFIGNNPWSNGSFSFEWPQRLAESVPDLGTRVRDRYDLDAVAAEAAGAWMRQHPLQALDLYRRKLWRCLEGSDEIVFWTALVEDATPPPSAASALEGPHPLKTHAALASRLAVAVPAVLFAFAVLGVAVGARLALRQPKARAAILELGLLTLAALYSPLLSSLFTQTGRYRWPTEALSLLPAGLALSWLVGLLGSGTNARGGPATGPSGAGPA